MPESLKNIIKIASGEQPAPLVLKNASIVNVFTEEICTADIAIYGNTMAGIGHYDGERETDLSGKYVCPGLIDGHIHLESSMVSPLEFEKVALPHGTTAVITDPHEIANVAGTEGIKYILDAAAQMTLDVFVMMPSCVPCTGQDESGAVLGAKDISPFYENPRVLGLAEMMNSYGVCHCDDAVLEKLSDAAAKGKIIDGHAPLLAGSDLNAYVASGISSDHECSTADEAMEKFRLGQWIMIREGTAAKNLESLMPLCQPPYASRCLFVTDDKHPNDLLESGHIDAIIRKAVRLGANPITAIQMGSWNAAQYFGLKDRGAVAPGYRADLVVLENLENFQICGVYKDGVPVSGTSTFLNSETGLPTASSTDYTNIASKHFSLLDCAYDHTQYTQAALADSLQGESLEQPDAANTAKLRINSSTSIQHALRSRYPRIWNSFHMPELSERDLAVPSDGARQRVMRLVPGQLLTEEVIIDKVSLPGCPLGVNPSGDIAKAAVCERHHAIGHVGIGFVQGYGIKKGAVASSIAHDSHNLMLIGVSDRDMILAGNAVRANGGGLAVAADGEILGELALPIAGLMSDMSVEETAARLEALKKICYNLGVSTDIDPFMTLAFLGLAVIPKIKLNTLGLIDVDSQQILDAFF